MEPLSGNITTSLASAPKLLSMFSFFGGLFGGVKSLFGLASGMKDKGGFFGDRFLGFMGSMALGGMMLSPAFMGAVAQGSVAGDMANVGPTISHIPSFDAPGM
jgi:hypothetical protein